MLDAGSALRDAPWLAVAVADRPATAVSARIRLAAVLDEDGARGAASHLLSRSEDVHWEDGDVVARRVERLGAVELSVRPLSAPDSGLVRQALLEGLRREGLGLLHWTREAHGLRERLAFLHRVLDRPWPDVSDAELLERADEWLEPELSRARRRADLGRVQAGQALQRLLPWATGDAARLDELAPERIEVPSGSRIRVEYGGEQPVLAVKLQELFGLRETPEVRRRSRGGASLYPRADRRRSRRIWPRSGVRVTGRCGRSCAAGIRSTPGPRTRRRRNRRGTRRHGSDP
ncbi:LOW QUALITY PROTEIN: ATP-dependent RNA helicase, partial [Streptomyces pristinaespiralis ATCC 25486]